jgi:hypothetical protein
MNGILKHLTVMGGPADEARAVRAIADGRKEPLKQRPFRGRLEANYVLQFPAACLALH